MKCKRGFSSMLAILLVCLFAGSEAKASDWPHFRGPNYDGVSTERGFKKTFSGSIKEVWKRDLGPAYSSVSIVGNRLYTCGTKEASGTRMQTLYCLDLLSGKSIWELPFEKEYKDSYGDGTRSTPTVANGLVYVLGGHGTILCADAQTGKKKWEHKFNQVPQWGYSGSVLVEGDLAISSAGGSQGALVAYDRTTGALKWKVGNDPVGYATPYPFTLDGKRYVVGFNGQSAVIAELTSGKQVLRIPWETSWKVNAASPIFSDGLLFLTSGYRTGSGVFKLTASDSRLNAQKIWSSQVMLNKFQSAVLHEGNLYASDQRRLVCADFESGEEKWVQVRDNSNSAIKDSPVLIADGHLIILTEKGNLEIAKATPNGYSMVSHTKLLSGRCWTVPVLHGGRLYARNLDTLVCFDMSDVSPTQRR